MSYKDWSLKERDILRRMWTAGTHINQIIKALDVSKGSIIGMASRMGLTRKRSTSVPRNKKLLNKGRRVMKRKGNPKWGRTMSSKSRKSNKPFEKYVPEVHVPIPGSTPVEMVDLKHQHCKFPFGEKHNMLFCGMPSPNHHAYCDEHRAVAILPHKPQNEFLMKEVLS